MTNQINKKLTLINEINEAGKILTKNGTEQSEKQKEDCFTAKPGQDFDTLLKGKSAVKLPNGNLQISDKNPTGDYEIRYYSGGGSHDVFVKNSKTGECLHFDKFTSMSHNLNLSGVGLNYNLLGQNKESKSVTADFSANYNPFKKDSEEYSDVNININYNPAATKGTDKAKTGRN